MKRSQDAILDGVQKEYVAHVEREYRRAIRSIDTKIRAWYQRLADNNGISFSEARKLLSKNELDEFHWIVKEYMRHAWENSDGVWEKELENASARIHITRLDALRTQLQQHVQELIDKQITAVQSAAETAYFDSYLHTAFEVQSEAGIGIRMQGVDPARLETVLKRPWTTDGKNFVARCWTDKKRLVNVLNRELTRMIATGENPDRAITHISKEFNTSRANAGRLINTESSFAAAQAQQDTFKELKVERYMIVATLSTTTCSECGDMDGLVFPLSEFKPGSTANPFHPNCRCTTKPYDEDVEKFAKRAARDAKTGERFEMPAGTTYADWKKMQDEKYGAGFVDTERKKAYNQSGDWEQFRQYQETLGKNAPKSFEEFQQLKYDNPNSYKHYKNYARFVRTGELTPLADFDLYMRASKKIDEVFVGTQALAGTEITGKSYHFIARTIGSVEERRDGVNLKDTFDALLNPVKLDDPVENWNGISQRYIGKNAIVSLNPETGVLIQVNPRKKKGGEKHD